MAAEQFPGQTWESTWFAPNLTPSIFGGTSARLTSSTNVEVLIIDTVAGATVDIQTWRVGGTVAADVTATGAVEASGMSFQNSLLTPGGNGSVGELAAGSLFIKAGPLSNGNITEQPLANAGAPLATTPRVHYVDGEGGALRSSWHFYGISLRNAQTLWGFRVGGLEVEMLRPTAGDETAIAALGVGGLSLFTPGFGVRVVQIDNNGAASASRLAFFGAAVVVRPAAYTQTYATATRTQAALTSANVATTASTQVAPFGYTTAAQADSIPTQINALRADLENVKQVLNSILDDLQAFGLLQ